MDDQDHLVLLTSVPTAAEASMIVASLKQAGVAAVMMGEFTAGFVAEAPGWVQVRVDQDSLPAAKELLARMKSESEGGEIDWSSIDVGQPEQGA